MHAIFTQIYIKTVQLYIIQLYVSKFPYELINKKRNWGMDTEICKKRYLKQNT